jgi:hypothetical protein
MFCLSVRTAPHPSVADAKNQRAGERPGALRRLTTQSGKESIMKTKGQLLTIIALIAMATTSLSPFVRAQRSSFININKIQFARDPNGQRGLTMFEPKDHVIYCIVGVSNPSADVKYKIVWSFYDRATNQHKELFTQELDNQTTNEVISKYSSPGDLAKGSYSVEIFVNDKSRGSRRFYV